MKKKFLILLFTLLCAFLVVSVSMLEVATAQTLQTDQFSLAWDANSEHNLAGYKIYYKYEVYPFDGSESGVPYDGTGIAEGDSPIVVNLADLEDQTNPIFAVTNVPDGLLYFALTAFDTDNLESDYSNEISQEVNADPPLAPVLQSVTPIQRE